MHCVRKSLNVSVVGYRDSLVSPCGRGFYKSFYVCHTVHGTHLGVHMKLYALFGCIIRSCLFLCLYNIVYKHGIFFCVVIVLHPALNLDVHSLFDTCQNLLCPCFRQKCLAGICVHVVCQHKCKKRLSAFELARIHGYNLAFGYHRACVLRNIGYFHCCIGGNIFAEKRRRINSFLFRFIGNARRRRNGCRKLL